MCKDVENICESWSVDIDEIDKFLSESAKKIAEHVEFLNNYGKVNETVE